MVVKVVVCVAFIVGFIVCIAALGVVVTAADTIVVAVVVRTDVVCI